MTICRKLKATSSFVLLFLDRSKEWAQRATWDLDLLSQTRWCLPTPTRGCILQIASHHSSHGKFKEHFRQDAWQTFCPQTSYYWKLISLYARLAWNALTLRPRCCQKVLYGRNISLVSVAIKLNQIKLKISFFFFFFNHQFYSELKVVPGYRLSTGSIMDKDFLCLPLIWVLLRWMFQTDSRRY